MILQKRSQKRTIRSREIGESRRLARDFRAVRFACAISSVTASSAMICIEERGGKPEQAGSVESRRRIDPVSAGPFALRFRLGASFVGIDRVGDVGGRLDIAVTQVAATYADLKRNNRIYFTRFRRYFSLVFLLFLSFFFFFFVFSFPWSFVFRLV